MSVKWDSVILSDLLLTKLREVYLSIPTYGINHHVLRIRCPVFDKSIVPFVSATILSPIIKNKKLEFNVSWSVFIAATAIRNCVINTG